MDWFLHENSLRHERVNWISIHTKVKRFYIGWDTPGIYQLIEIFKYKLFKMARVFNIKLGFINWSHYKISKFHTKR